MVSPYQAHATLTAAGYRHARGTPSEEGRFTFTVTEDDITHTANTTCMTLADIGH